MTNGLPEASGRPIFTSQHLAREFAYLLLSKPGAAKSLVLSELAKLGAHSYELGVSHNLRQRKKC